MFEIKKEDYEELEKSLKEILDLLEKIDHIKIGEKTFKIVYYIGADYKMLRLLYGQKSSNANETCVWCRFDTREIPKPKENFPIWRNLNDIDTYLKPLIKFIPFENCVVDLLHLLLGITDLLYKLLIFKLVRIDKNNGNNIRLRPNLKVFWNFLEKKCKISNPFYISKEEINLRSFNGNERIKIFEVLYKPYYEENDKISKKLKLQGVFTEDLDPPYNFTFEDFVWSGFYDILLQIKSFRDYTNPFKLKHIPTSSEELSEDFNNWLESYLFINELNRNSIKITPYIHVFVNHIPQFLEIHQNINSFNTQGSEKLNGFCTHYYHRCTNKQHKKYLNQSRKRIILLFY